MRVERLKDDEIVPWYVLGGKGTRILESIGRKWQAQVSDPHVQESTLQHFLAEHAALFFGQDTFAISQAELGSEYQADFVIVSDEASDGINYEFVEIERPQCPLYTRSGNPSAKLTHAVQQIQDWRAWLTRHRGHVRRFFPSQYFGWDEFTNLSFTVVIGRRNSPSVETAKRNALARQMDIRICSFDRLTDALRSRFKSLWTFAPYDELGRPGDLALNQLANPFARAYSWKEWKSVAATAGRYPHHFAAYCVDALLAHRSYSKELGPFSKWWRSLSAREQARRESRGLKIENILRAERWMERQHRHNNRHDNL